MILTFCVDRSVWSDRWLLLIRCFILGDDSRCGGVKAAVSICFGICLHATLRPDTESASGSSNINFLVLWLYSCTSLSFRSTNPCSPPVNVFFGVAGAASFFSAAGPSALAFLPRKEYPKTPAPAAAAPTIHGVAELPLAGASVAYARMPCCRSLELAVGIQWIRYLSQRSSRPQAGSCEHV